MTLYLLRYNNYYNRIVKRKTSVAEYLDWAEDYQGPITGVNFVPGDGVSTTALINHPDNSRWDYLLVVDAANEIAGRWFIIDETRTAGGQWKMTLYRDLIAEWYDDIVEAPVFIEKAMLAATDPAIFNSENMTFNQIKKAETPITDNTKSAWIVGYLNKKEIELGNRSVSIPAQDVVVAGEYTDEDSFPFKDGIVAYPSDPLFRADIDLTGDAKFSVGWNANNELESPTVGVTPTSTIGISKPESSTLGNATGFANQLQDNLNNSRDPWDSQLNVYLDTATKTLTESYLAANGNIYKIGDVYYRFLVAQETPTHIYTKIASGSNLSNNIKNLVANSGIRWEYIEDAGIEWTRQAYKTLLLDIKIDLIEFTMSDNIVETEDAPYNMFAIPYHRWLRDDPEGLYSDPVNCRRIAEALQLKLGKDLLYDLQLLPYCPFPQEYRTVIGSLKTSKIPTSGKVWYQDITMGDTYIGSILYCNKTSFSFSVNGPNIPISINPIEIKVDNECDMYRLCSPNYNGQFEFSAVKNGGVSQWNIDCTYKPYQPYIHVAPDFGGLYGKDFDDARGLICGGDFSLSQVIDRWQEYQVQNKNFQNIFDRQIENMEVQNKYALGQETVGAMVGAGQGAVTGAIVGGPWGALAGGLTATAAGIADVSINERLRAEAMDYTKDQFGYQLGNIKALPYSLSKVSAYNANNKIFPFLEYYTATDIEKQALRDKITYNGMSVGRIGTISQFQQLNPTYIKGKLIRLEGTGDDYHIINSISAEINKGVFI